MTAHVLVTASNDLGTRKLFKKPGSGDYAASTNVRMDNDSREKRYPKGECSDI